METMERLPCMETLERQSCMETMESLPSMETLERLPHAWRPWRAYPLCVPIYNNAFLFEKNIKNYLSTVSRIFIDCLIISTEDDIREKITILYVSPLFLLTFYLFIYLIIHFRPNFAFHYLN